MDKKPEWSESVAIGSIDYISEIIEKLGVSVKSWKIQEKNGVYQLREPESSYNTDFNTKNKVLRENNTYFWDL